MVQMDYQFGALQQQSQQAYLLAESGLEYYKARSGDFSPPNPGSVSKEYGVPAGDTVHHFKVTKVLPSGDIISQGIIYKNYSANKIWVTRTIIAPGGNFSKQYDASL
eukprot:TRINITY_DN80116_c0_g1_i1.p2 TRINITY_DN80116_c0_g1~~TRINITY_DN80116_c0_g1_i1.p2  ORF type:complete len:107 (-),score=19.37 TRINITY_DN80116_c0_g1_i1:66-386(-)